MEMVFSRRWRRAVTVPSFCRGCSVQCSPSLEQLGGHSPSAKNLAFHLQRRIAKRPRKHSGDIIQASDMTTPNDPFYLRY